MYFPQLKKM
jgi:hypothetical protein